VSVVSRPGYVEGAVTTNVSEQEETAQEDADERGATETLARQSSITFAGDVFGKVFGFLIVAAITRLVSPGIYGLYTLAVSTVLLIQTLAGIGLPKAIDYFVPQHLYEGDREQARRVLLTVTVLVISLSSIVAVGLIALRQGVAVLFGEPSLAFALLLLAVTLPMLAVYRVVIASFNAVKQLQYRVYVRNIVRPISRFVVTVTLLIAGYGLIGLVVGYIAGLLFAAIVGAAILLTRVPQLAGRPSGFANPKPLVAYSAPLAIAGLIYVILGQIDYFVLGFFRSAEDVGIYRVAYMLAANLLIFFTAVAPVFKPLVAEVRHDEDAVEDRYRTATRWVAGLTLPVTIVLALGGGVYLALIFTQQYAVAAYAVAILAVGYLVNVTCGGPDGPLLQGLGHSRVVFVNTVILLGTNIVLSILLVPPFGITGAATATATALVLTGIANVTEAYVLRSIHPFTWDLAKLFLSAVPAVVAGAVIVLLFPDVVVALALPVVVFVVYVAAIVVSDAVTDKDVAFAAEMSPTVERLVRRANGR